MGAKLEPDMKCIQPKSIVYNLLTEKEHGFHEGVSVRKRNGVYYAVYTDISRGRATCLAYATSISPLGPYIKQGTIIDNTGCDPQSWNNHGSIAEIDGKWYVFYHRSTHCSKFSRRVCIETIEFNSDGSIDGVEMTTQGVGAAIVPTTVMEAANACVMHGEVHIRAAEREQDSGYEFLSHIPNGDWAVYRYYDMQNQPQAFCIEVASLNKEGEIHVRLDSPMGEEIATIPVGDTGGWQKFVWLTTAVKAPVPLGQHALYLCFTGDEGRLFSIRGFKFVE